MKNQIFVLVTFCLVGLCIETANCQEFRTVALTGEAAAGTTDAVFQDLGSPIINSSGQLIYSALLSGSGVTLDDRRGVWWDDGVSTLVARAEDPAPGSDIGETFRGLVPWLNDQGHVAFTASLRNSTGFVTGSSPFLWNAGNTELISPDERYATIRNFNSNGEVVLRSFDALNDMTLWAGTSGSIDKVVKEGDQAFGTDPGVSFSTITSFVPIQNGTVTYRGFLTGAGVSSDNDVGLWQWNGGSTTLLAREGDLIRSDSSQTFGGFADVESSRSGDLAFGGVIDGVGDAFFRRRSGEEFEVVVRDGGLAPGTEAGTRFDDLLSISTMNLNARGNIVWSSALAGSSIDENNDSGIWMTQGDSIELIAREGEQAPDSPIGVLIGRVIGSASGPIINDADQIAFTGELTSSGASGTGIFATDLEGNLRLIVREGDLLEVRPGDFRSISLLGFADGTLSEGNERSGFSNNGQIAFRASFSDGSEGIFVSNMVSSVPEPRAVLLVAMGLAGLFARKRTRDL